MSEPSTGVWHSLIARWRDVGVRGKLFLLAAIPLSANVLLLVLFLWVDTALRNALRDAEKWNQHYHATHAVEEVAEEYILAIGYGADAAVLEKISRELASRSALSKDIAAAFTATEQERHDRLLDSVAVLKTRADEIRTQRHSSETQQVRELFSYFEEHLHRALSMRMWEQEKEGQEAIAAAHRIHRRGLQAALAAAAIAVIGSFLVSVTIAKHLGTRVSSLARQTQRVAAGDFAAAADVPSRDELGDLARVFNEMVSTLRRQRSERLGFLAAVAHDLRNPLTAMKTAVNGIATAPTLPTETSLRRRIELVGRQIDRLARLADDLVDAVHVEAGQFELRLETCDLRSVAHDAAKLYAGASALHPIDLRLPEEVVPIRCDPSRLRQVLDNLLSNAIKYSPRGGPIVVEVRKPDGYATISVADRGVGMEPEDRAKIFEPFRRVSPTRDVLPGVGLGLATAKRIVAALGGAIEVETAPGVGSTFEVRLPLSTAQSP